MVETIRESSAKMGISGSLTPTGEQSYHSLLEMMGFLHHKRRSFEELSILGITQERGKDFV